MVELQVDFVDVCQNCRVLASSGDEFYSDFAARECVRPPNEDVDAPFPSPYTQRCEIGGARLTEAYVC